ncbi:hypothetical protein [Planctomycetes bacterium TBK1r]|uniref:Nucleotidyltransferase n=1 Tax=Stieleria magnilauensis TaxID=2527963 RepID=A0ABX5XXW1_9BACT|nr:hypothetical protein TBK1r_58930 [Planctomycetes bacterium TBK1r]
MADPAPSDFTDPAFLAAREAAMRAMPAPPDAPPWRPPSYADALRISEKITSDYRELHRPDSMDVKPSEVCAALQQGGVKNWVLMGLHGYVGYMSDPRATQDVDVLVPYSQKKKAVKAILQRWPTLIVGEMEFVVRFKDPDDLDEKDQPKVVIDLMLPWGKLHEFVLQNHVLVDPKSGHQIPSFEAALACKYAPMVSPYRQFERKAQDAADFRKMIKFHNGVVDRDMLRQLGNMVWENGGEEILSFVDLAMTDKQFPL